MLTKKNWHGPLMMACAAGEYIVGQNFWCGLFLGAGVMIVLIDIADNLNKREGRAQD
jgi:hypothetical protein